MGANPRSLLSPGQIAQKVYEDATDEIRVKANIVTNIEGDVEVAIDSGHDSVAIGDTSGNLVTVTTSGSKKLLDVNVVASSSGDTFKLVPFEFDEVDVTAKNSDGNPTIVVYKSSASTVATLNITYDSDGDFQSVVRS